MTNILLNIDPNLIDVMVELNKLQKVNLIHSFILGVILGSIIALGIIIKTK